MSANADSREPPLSSELVSEVIETRKQLIKATNALGNLSAEVRQVTRAQEQQHRSVTINSLVAYVLFAALAVGGAWFVHRAEVEKTEFEKAVIRRQHAKVQTELERVREKLRNRQDAEARAVAFYQQMSSERSAEALKGYPEVARLPLSRVEAAVFSRWAERKRSGLAYGAYSAGMRHLAKESWRRAVVEFKRSLEFVPRPPHAPSLHYYLGIALAKLGSYREAADALQRALELRADKNVSAQLQFQLGGVYEALNQRPRALASYRAYLRHHPKGGHARLARLRIKALSRK